MSWFDRLKQGLSKTRSNLIGRVQQVLSSHSTISPELLEEIEELLVTSDLGIDTATAVINTIKQETEDNPQTNPDAVEDLLKRELLDRLKGAEGGLALRDDGQPTVILVTGVNGSGKTTTIAKLGNKFSAQGKDVVFAAADTFRAGANEQLQEWANRLDIPLIKHDPGADPSAVAYDALEHTLSNDGDLLFVDTAGRLQTKHNLMEELKKIDSVLAKRLGRSVDERLLTLDATNGQNGISQAEKFNDAIDISGIVLTKLDGTAKGGVIFPIFQQLRIPIKFIGVGESPNDLHQFSKREFIEALFQ